MTRTIPYSVGYAHGLRGLPPSKMFTPDTSFEAQQYKQGYIDGSVALEDDIGREKEYAERT